MSDKPLYVQIYQNLLSDIVSGKYSKNQRLPTEQELSNQYFVSRITGKKAMNMLAEENIIVRIKGKGSYVSPHYLMNITKPAETKLKAVGLVLSGFSDSYGLEVFMTIEKQCRAYNAQCILQQTDGSQDVESRALEFMIEHGVDGIIIMPVHGTYYSAAVLRLILDGFPIVVVDRDLRGIPTNFVGTDNITAARAAMDLFVRNGHKKIGIYSPYSLTKTSSLEDRLAGVQQCIDNNNVSGVFYSVPYTGACEAIMEHIKSNLDMTAILTMEYHIAVVVKTAMLRMGLRVPEDISIICFDSPKDMHSPLVESRYEFTHIRQDEKMIGEEAFKLLLSLVRKGNTEAVKVLLPSEIKIGASTKTLGDVVI